MCILKQEDIVSDVCNSSFLGGYKRKDEAIATLISEIVLVRKESNKKTRNSAYDLLI